MMLEGQGKGGRWAPRTHTVYVHQMISSATITVVICMIFSALWLDSGMPLIFSHQKYNVMKMAKHAAVKFSESTIPRWKYANSSFKRPARYCPAETPLIGPVKT